MVCGKSNAIFQGLPNARRCPSFEISAHYPFPYHEGPREFFLFNKQWDDNAWFAEGATQRKLLGAARK